MEGRQLVGCVIYYVLLPYGGQREPFSSDVEQLAFKFRRFLRKLRKNCCAQSTLADDLHGIAPGLGNIGTAGTLNRVGPAVCAKQTTAVENQNRLPPKNEAAAGGGSPLSLGFCSRLRFGGRKQRLCHG